MVQTKKIIELLKKAEPIMAKWESDFRHLQKENDLLKMVRETVIKIHEDMAEVLKRVKKFESNVKMEPVLEAIEEAVKAVQNVEQNVEKVIQRVVTTAVQEEWKNVPAPRRKTKGTPKQDTDSKIKVIVEARNKKCQAAEIQDRIKSVLVKKT